MFKQGILKKLENGRFGIVTKELSCGSIVELYISKDNTFIKGRIEANMEGEYYFLSNEGQAYNLEDNMFIAYEE